jgi:uncharacterized protein
MKLIKGSVSVEFAGQTLGLLPERAIWWEARSTVVIADAHFGKAASFRKTGVPVPAGATTKDLGRLDALLEKTGARRVIVLGDFWHSRAGRQAEVLEAIEAWRKSRAAVEMILVRGNHDRSAGRVPVEWGIVEVEEPFEEEGICLIHDPDCTGKFPALAGHVHPVVSLEDYDGSSVTVPCFVVDEGCLILPAFGTFTGGFRMSRQLGRRIFVVAAERVIALRAVK